MATPLARIRNIGIIAHIDAGKTTTTERMLYYTGVSHALGTVDDGNTVTDWMEQEKERGITITSATITCTWRKHQINLIDTPGHVDFTAEVERALRVLDGAVVVLDSVAGVEPQSETVWNQARRYHIPRFVVVNKLDRLGADFVGAVEDVREKLHTSAIPIQWPIGAEDRFVGVVDLIENQALIWDQDDRGATYRTAEIPEDVRPAAEAARETLIETLAAEDEGLLERYVAGETPDPDTLRAVLRQLVLAGEITPVLAAAALRNRGIQPILDAVVDYLPAPFEVPAARGVDREGKGVELPCDPDGPLAALVFKTFTDSDRRRVNYIRVYSGAIRTGDRVLNASRDTTERISRLVSMQADRAQKIDTLPAGEIGVAVGLKHAATGDTLCDPNAVALLERMSFPEPVISAALEARTSAAEEKIQNALDLLAMDDPTFTVRLDENTGQRIISGMGELHLEVIAVRLEREFRLPIRLGKPQVEYRETITVPAQAGSIYDRSMGGRDHFARVTIALSPLPPGSGNRFESRLGGDGIPEEFLEVTRLSAMGALDAGVMGGYRVLDVAVHLVAAEAKEELSSDIAFAGAARNAVKDGLRAGQSVLLEPVMTIEITTPKEFTGGILTSLAARRGRVQSTELRGSLQIIRASVPLSQMFGYATELRSASQGRATYSMEFDRFDRVVG